MVAFLPIALAAAGALSAYQKNHQYRPIAEANSGTGALLDILGAGLGGYAGGSLLGGGLGGAGLAGGLLGGGVDTAALPQRQAGPPRFIPAAQLPQLGGGLGGLGFLPGESGGIPQGGGFDIGTLALLSQLGLGG